MVDITLKNLQRQIIIFLGLSVVNIIFAAIALAIGVVFVVNNLFPILETGVIDTLSIGYVIAGGCLAIVGFWWILPSTSIMDFITDLQIKSNKKNQKSSDEQEIGLIIQLLSYYRENEKKIKQMILISRIGGTFFLINGIITTYEIITKTDGSFTPGLYTMQIAAVIMMFTWGIVSFVIPYFLKKTAEIWQYRVRKSREAEDILRKHLETT